MVYEVILDTILYVCFFNWLFEDNAYVLLVIDNIFSVIKKSTSFNSIFEVNLRVVFMVNRYGSLKYPTLK